VNEHGSPFYQPEDQTIVMSQPTALF